MLRNNVARLWLIVSLLYCFAATGWAADVQVSAELNPSTFAQDQGAELVITVNGASSAQPELPAAEGLRFRSLGQSSQTSWVNGQVSASVAFSFIVQAEKIGQHTIGPVKVTADGKTYTTQPVSCTVSPAQNSSGTAAVPPTGSNSAPQTEEESENIGFLRILPQTDKFYAGQLVPFTIKAYFKPGRRIHLKTTPSLIGENFLLQSLDQEPSQQQEQVNGEQFTALTWYGVLSAIKEGTAALSVQVDADLMVREQSQPHGSPFDAPFSNDPFFDDFFGRYTPREIKLASPEKTVTVLSLPNKNRPADFKGAVGMFSLAVAASGTDGRPGDPITLKMKIGGSGNFDSVQAPELTDSKGWKLYPASASFIGQPRGKSEKTFEQAIVPVGSNLTAVPPLHFSYFDPAAGDYVTLKSEPIPLQLQQAAEPVPPPAQQQPPPPLKNKKNQAEPKARKHFVFLRSESEKIVRNFQPLYEKHWFLTTMAGAGCCLVSGLLLDLRRKKLESNPSLVLRKQVEKKIARHFREMKAAAAAKDQERFRLHCQEAVQKRTGAAWGRAPEAITLADLSERLPADAPLLALFARLEQSSYAAQHLEKAEMEAMLQIAQQELDKLA
ncbi:MAG: Oxygen tolerance [Candidatus Electronema aureum]|uniref:Oxygen tolerance n=1 Tax=Candidatus Electronema aureum TaxID=2005002 RepID=A0A521G2Y9_9BACT|nr:MAG: Oxygen tolerance [Candidatus Electronema aureum]